MQDRQAAHLEARLDQQQYQDDELISIKTPLNLPYYTSSPEFERAYGNLEVNGVIYQYVKRRVKNDTLELLCLPDREKTNLRTLKNDFVKFSLDGVTSQQEKKTNASKISFPDFCQEMQILSFWIHAQDKMSYFNFNTLFLQSDYSSKGEQPPENLV